MVCRYFLTKEVTSWDISQSLQVMEYLQFCNKHISQIKWLGGIKHDAVFAFSTSLLHKYVFFWEMVFPCIHSSQRLAVTGHQRWCLHVLLLITFHRNLGLFPMCSDWLHYRRGGICLEPWETLWISMLGNNSSCDWAYSWKFNDNLFFRGASGCLNLSSFINHQ